MAERYPYHRNLYERLQRADLDEGQTIFGALSQIGWQGPRQVTFRDAARATAEATAVLGLLPFEDASVLVGLYDAQDQLDDIEQGFSDAAFNPAMLDDSNARSALVAIGVYFNMVVEDEQNLLVSYREAIRALDLDIAPAADSLLIDR